jgi:hypothetical protein
MRVVFPGESDAPVHLDVEFGVADVGGERQRRGHRGDETELRLVRRGVLARRACGVPDGGDPGLGANEHVRAVMLDRLECGDGAPELLPHLRVVDGGVDAVRRTAHRLGGQQGSRQGQCRLPRPCQDVGVGHPHVLQTNPPGSPCRIEVFRHLDRDTLAVALEHQHVVARGDQQQLGKPGTQHDSGLTIGDAVGDPYLAVQAGARGDGSVDQAGQQPRLLFGRTDFGDHRGGDHGGHERSRRHRATEFFDHDHEFGEPEP